MLLIGAYSLSLDLSNNPLGCDGLLSLFRVFKKEGCLVACIDLQNTVPLGLNRDFQPNIQYEITANKYSTMTNIDLSRNDFSQGKVTILAKCFQVCPSLRAVQCRACSITSNDFIGLLITLKSASISHRYLKVWNLQDNIIDDQAVTSLIENSRKLFPVLVDVGLDGNLVSERVEIALHETIKVSCTRGNILNAFLYGLTYF